MARKVVVQSSSIINFCPLSPFFFFEIFVSVIWPKNTKKKHQEIATFQSISVFLLVTSNNNEINSSPITILKSGDIVLYVNLKFNYELNNK